MCQILSHTIHIFSRLQGKILLEVVGGGGGGGGLSASGIFNFGPCRVSNIMGNFGVFVVF